jgi:hypothetical protein
MVHSRQPEPRSHPGPGPVNKKKRDIGPPVVALSDSNDL